MDTGTTYLLVYICVLVTEMSENSMKPNWFQEKKKISRPSALSQEGQRSGSVMI